MMAESDPYPSGGVAVARVAELAAALAAAAADYSRGHWAEAGGARAQAQSLGRRTAKLADDEADTYATARRALADRSATPGSASGSETQAERDWKLRLAVQQAAEAPLELAVRAADIAALSREIASRAVDDVRTDAVIAALLAATASRAAARLVRINLAVGEGAAAAIASEHADAAAAAAAAAEAFDL